MPRPIAAASLVVLIVAGFCQVAMARALTVDRLRQAKDDPSNYLIDGDYQRGEARLARMREAGELPDTLKASGCRFDLAGDPGVAYYVKTCP